MTTPNLEGICVLVDGGCLNNNGPVANRGMYGSLAVLHNGKVVVSHLTESVQDLGDGVTTRTMDGKVHKFPFGTDEDDVANNQRAELKAMKKAFEYVAQLHKRHPLTAVRILSDSEYALGWASGQYKGNRDTATVVLDYAQLFKSHRTVLSDVKLSFDWVPNGWVKTVLGH